jgi:hypothetical protein
MSYAIDMRYLKLRHSKDCFKIDFQEFLNRSEKTVSTSNFFVNLIFSSGPNPRCTIKFVVTLTTVAIVFMKCQLSRPNLCFTLCLLKRGVQVRTYDFGFMDDSITN